MLIGAMLGLAPAVSSAQAGSVAVTPFFGVFVPVRSLLAPPTSTDPARDAQKVDVSLVFGGRAALGISPHWGVEADAAYASGRLVLSTIGPATGNDVKTLMASGRIYYRSRLPTEPFVATASAGLGLVSHRFTPTSAASSATIGDKTNVGAVLGGTIAFRLSNRAALVFGADAFLYSIQLDYEGQLTDSRSQVDLRLFTGLRIPVAGL